VLADWIVDCELRIRLLRTSDESRKVRLCGDMLTIQKWLEGVGRNRQQMSECPSWPPDLFAICASLLKRSGSYLRVFERGPQRPDWTDAREEGRKWRKGIDSHTRVTAANLQGEIPRAVHRNWAGLLQAWDTRVSEIVNDHRLTDVLIRLALIADAASDGIGICTDKTPFYAAARGFSTTTSVRALLGTCHATLFVCSASNTRRSVAPPFARCLTTLRCTRQMISKPAGSDRILSQ
jgi:hypothetical protein